ncbi:MAG: EAL domain-containing protein [Methylococcaceae bacterium]|nr:EAL domain-containing protein [Methylococcaceae bacterium]
MEAKVISLRSGCQVTTEQAGQLLALQREILEQVALNVDYREILDALCKAAEQIVPNSVASIMIFDETGESLTVLAAPSIPLEAVALLNGLIPSERAGSCGTAVYYNEAQYVVNTRVDDRWSDLQAFAHDFSINACWSNPVKIEKDKAIGSFALSSFEERAPSIFYKQLLETCAHIVGILLIKNKKEESLWKLAHYDTLTGLVNRNLLKQKLSAAIGEASSQKYHLAVLVLDLDGFKDVNDWQGYEVGDKVLQQVAKNIEGILDGSYVFSRLGSDEFVILVGGSGESLSVQLLIGKILALFKKKVHVADCEFTLSVSIGVSLFPEDGLSASDLLRNADTAMHAAKKAGRACSRFYNEGLTNFVKYKMDLITGMRIALVRGDFVLHYQPQYCQKTNKLAGVEALVRWQHPEKGLIPPNDFIPLAEESGFIQELGLWLFAEACRQCKAWWDGGIPEFSLAINLSVKQLDADNIKKLQAILLTMKFPIYNLELEVTESLIMHQESLTALHQLEALGIRISMDDFGTGYSSLAQLKHLPISKLKIDRSFVKDLSEDENDRIIAKTIIAMGHSLGLIVVAEGVETVEQQAFLVQEGCDLIQGYLLSRPLTVEQFSVLFQTPS